MPMPQGQLLAQFAYTYFFFFIYLIYLCVASYNFDYFSNEL